LARSPDGNVAMTCEGMVLMEAPLSAHEMHTLAPLPRTVLRWDARLSLIISAVGLVAAPLEADLTGLPVALILGAAIALLPYGLAGEAVSRVNRVPRAAVLALAGFNGAWALVTVLLSRSFIPTALGVGLLAANVLLPGAVGAVLAKAAARHELVSP
jgi:hypothetical protein